MEKLKHLISKCKGSVTVEVNGHRDCYETVEDYLQDDETWLEETDPEVVRKMIELDNIITILFYQHTPIGFKLVAHYDLECAIDEALANLD